jgi:hypothetical protein
VFSAGKSVEGRDLTGIHIWGSGGKGSKKGVVLHGTVRKYMVECNGSVAKGLLCIQTLENGSQQ